MVVLAERHAVGVPRGPSRIAGFGGLLRLL